MRNSIFFVAASSLFCVIAYAKDAGLESFVRGSNAHSAGLASSDNAANVIPKYSESKEQATKEFSRLDDAELQHKANQKQSEMQSSDTMTILKKKPLDNFENHEMFKKADKIYQDIEKDPDALLKSLTSENCSQRINEAKNHYTRHTVKNSVQDIEYEEKTCELSASNISCKEVRHVTCAHGSECDAGISDIQASHTDIHAGYSASVFSIGRFGDNSWHGGRCTPYDRTIKFNIANPEDLTLFSLFEAGYDDLMLIQVNGNAVFMGPHGHWNFNTRRCELGTNYGLGRAPIDLRPYLKQGENTIWMRVLVGGVGEGWIRIRARQNCCAQIKEELVKTCWAS